MDGNNEQLYIKGQPIIQLKFGEAHFWSIVSFGGQIQYKGIASGTSPYLDILHPPEVILMVGVIYIELDFV